MKPRLAIFIVAVLAVVTGGAALVALKQGSQSPESLAPLDLSASASPSPINTALAHQPPATKMSAEKDANATYLAQGAGWLSVHGTDIVSENGLTVILHGVNKSGLEYGAGAPWLEGKCENPRYGCWAIQDDSRPIDAELEDMAHWGFNFVRVPISWSNLEPIPPRIGANGEKIHSWNSSYLNALDEIVASSVRKHLRVILSMHQWDWSPVFLRQPAGRDELHGLGFPVWLYPNANGKTPGELTQAKVDFFMNKDGIQNDYAEVWSMIAARYAHTPTVIGADIINEPNLKDCSGTCGDQNHAPIPLDGLYTKVAAAIHSVNPHLLLIFEDDASTPMAAAPTFSNAVYSFHLYPKTWDDAKKILDGRLARSRAWNVPVWLGEFDRFDQSANWQTPIRTLAQYLHDKRLNWSYWAYARTRYSLDPQYQDKQESEADRAALIAILQNGF